MAEATAIALSVSRAPTALLPHASQPEKAVTQIDTSFRDFGAPVSVNAPPPGQTTTE